MDVATLARNQSVNRILIGAGLITFPGLFARPWIGSGATEAHAKVVARALGARDLALGAAGLLALRDGQAEWARRSFAAQAFADGVDLAAILFGRGSPRSARLIGGTMAAGSAAVAGAYAAQL